MIENAGTAEATDVSIEFSLPDFVFARASDNLPKQPTEPASGTGWSDLPDIMPLSGHLQPRSPRKPYFGRGGSLSFVIPSFAVSFAITCREIIDPISGELNFILPEK